LTRTQEIIELFKDRFVQRTDCYPIQYSNNGGGYNVIRDELTDQIIRRHLKGDQTIGLYGSSNSHSKWLCIDVDELEEASIREVQNHARRFGIPYLTEFSGKKGYHLWIFFDRAYPNRIIRALASEFAFGHEVFPKQDYILSNGLGSLVKAPLGKHQLSGNWCLFVDRDLKPEKDQYGKLANASRINPIQIIKDNLPETWAKVKGENEVASEKPPVQGVTGIPIIKDCVRNGLMKGVSEGERNQVGHIIATELRNANINKVNAATLLESLWNVRNKPPLNARELQQILDYSYGAREYTYGCKESSLLRKHLECVGQDRCLYLATLKAYSGAT